MENIKKMRIGKIITAWFVFLMMCITLLPTNVSAAVYATRQPNVRIMFSDGKTMPSSGYAKGNSFSFDALSGTTVGQPSQYYSAASNYTFLSYSCYDGGGMGTSSVTKPGDWWNPSGTIYMTINVRESSTGGSSSGSGSSGGSTTSGSHSVNVNFRIVYLDNDEFNLGYNYGNTYSTTFNCQYSNCSTTNSYSNHCIALNDIGAAKNYMTNNGYVNSGWEIVGWGKDAKRNMSYSTTWTGTGYGSGGTTCQNNGYIEIVAKKKASYTIFINCYDQNNNLIYSTQENDKYAGDYYYVTAPSVSGYTATGTTVQNGTMPNGNKTLNFYYQSNVQNVTVTYMDRTMTYATETKTLGSEFTVKNCTNTRGSYVFVGWSETYGATTVDYEVGDGITPDSDLTLYAVWQSKKVKLTYEPNGGTGSSTSTEYNKGDSAIVKSVGAVHFERSGYKFLGWSTDARATAATYFGGDELPMNSDTILYAVWKDMTPVTLTYDANGGDADSVPESLTLTKGSTYRLSEQVPTRDGYVFAGWSREDQLGTSSTLLTTYDFTLNEDTTVYARWNIPYTINFDLNGGKFYHENKRDLTSTRTSLLDTIKGYYDMRVYVYPTYSVKEEDGEWHSYPKWTKEGYTFLGWADTPEATEATYINDNYKASYVNLTAENPSKTVYAVWKKVEPTLIETPFAIQLSFCYLENGRADIPDNFQLEMEITNENVPEFKLTKTLTKADATETTNGGPALLWELNEKLPQSFANASHTSDNQGSEPVYGYNTVKITAVNGDVPGYQFTMRSGGDDPTDARGGAQVRELTFTQAGSTNPHQHNFFNTYVIPHKATHYYYDSVDDYNKGNVGGTVVVESDGTSGKPHLETTQKAWNGITAEKKSYDGKSYIVMDKPESFAVTQATKNFEFKYIRKITVTWQKEDGSEIKSEEIPNGSDYEELYPGDPSATGDWSEPDTDGNGNITIKWTEPTTYTVTYKDGANGTVFADQPYTVKENGATPDFVGETKRENYVFKGWTPEVAETVTGDATYTAVWKDDKNNNGVADEDEPYTVTYTDGVNGDAFDDQVTRDLLYGANTPAFDGTPEREGYTFDGWSPEVAKTVTGDATYTAQWECAHEHDEDGYCTDPDCKHDDDCCPKAEKFTVTYVDGVDGTAFAEQSYTVKKGTNTPGFVGEKVRENYVFAGWDKEIAATVTEDVVYTAIWKDDKNNNGIADEDEPYTVTYTDGVNGEAFTDKVIDNLLYGVDTPAFDENGAEPEREGYTFEGWSPEVADTVTGTVIYTAQWKRNSSGNEDPETFTVKYVDGVNGGAFAEQSYTVEEGTETPEFDGTPEREGYTFTGWSPEVSETVTGNVTYTAQWKRNTHKVTWITPDDEVIDEKDVPDGEEVDPDKYPTPPTPPEGKEFDKWEVGDPDESGDIKITVVWKDAEKTYTLSYDANEGTGAPANQSETTTEDSVTFMVADGMPVRDGYTFEGWTENLLARNPLYTAGEEITISEDTTLYAVWTKKDEPVNPPEPEKTHSVTWMDGYTDTPIKTLPDVKEGQDIADEYPENPRRSGYTFDGWEVSEPDEDGNIIITATWKKKNGGGNGGGTVVTKPDNGNNGGSNGGGNGGGGGMVSIPDANVPLAAAPGLNNTDHFAYIIGYVDGTVRPENNISRAEVATIFFRLMTDEFRSASWSAENGFSDVQAGVWYNNAISTGTNAGLIKGYEDGTFAPENAITRAEFAAIAARFLSDDAPSNSTFDDVAGHWAEPEIKRAVAAGWIRGKGNNQFAPDEYITRAEVMTLVNRMLDRVGDEEAMLDDMVKWIDNPETAWYYADVQEATNGHNYERDELGITETWTELTPNRDWSELER